MELFEALILGIIQGVTEWLPVSSEAVITLTMTRLFNQSVVSSLNSAIWLHTGTMLAALIYFREDFYKIFIHFAKERETAFDGSEEAILGKFLIASTLLTGLIGGTIYILSLENVAEYPELFSGLMAGALFLTGFLRIYSTENLKSSLDIGLEDSLLVGVLQGFSILPGISRSGITSFGFLYREYSAEDAFRLSFLMSVPAILAANIGLELFSGFTVSFELVLASAVAFTVGLLTIDAVLKIADRSEIAYICFALGFIALLPVVI